MAVNTLASAVDETFRVNGQDIRLNLVAGPYLRVEAANTSILIGAQSIRGDFVLQRRTGTDGTQQIPQEGRASHRRALQVEGRQRDTRFPRPSIDD